MPKLDATRERDLYERVAAILEETRGRVVRTVNTAMVHAYWHIGREIVQVEQLGKSRAAYREELIDGLSKRLVKQFGQGFSARSLRRMRQFFLTYPEGSLLPSELRGPEKQPAVLAKTDGAKIRPALLAKSTSLFPPALGWAHYLLLLSVRNTTARAFYEIEAARENWSTRELERQIGSLLFERLAKSRNKDRVLALAREGQRVETASDVMKEPLVLEFLGLEERASWLGDAKGDALTSVVDAANDASDASINSSDGSDGAVDASADAGCGSANCNGVCVDTATDPANCGRCSHDCQGGACEGGTCQPVLLAMLWEPFGIAVNGSGVYVTECSGGVVRLGLDGGTPTTVSTGGCPEYITANDAGVFWVEWDVGDDAGVSVVRTRGQDGGPATLATVPNLPGGIAVDQSNVYWTSIYDGPGNGGAVYQVGIGGGSPVALQASPYPLGVAVDAENIYWVDAANQAVLLGPRDGSAVVTLATAQVQPTGIAVSNGTVYWSSPSAYVRSTPVSGGAISDLAPAFGGYTDIALDNAYVYMPNDGNLVLAVPL